MNEYICVVKKINGDILKNYKVQAENEPSLITHLKEKQLFLISYRSRVVEKKTADGPKIRLSSKDLTMFCRQLSSMLISGVTIVKALNILYLQMEKKNIRQSIQLLYESVQKGEQFSEGLRKQQGVYPEMMISMVEAGEASGKLDKVMVKLADQFESDMKLKSKIKSAMTYPIILTVLCIGVILILVLKVLPTFTELLEENDAELPAITKALVGFSDILTSRWFVIIAMIGVIVLSAKTYTSTETGKRQWHQLKLSMPVLGKLTEKIVAVRFTRTLSTLLSSGMSMMQALEIVTKVVSNRVVMDKLEIAREDIRTGMSLSESLKKTGAMPPMVYSMIGIGEESGSIEDMMEKSAIYYDDEVENGIQGLVSLMEPIMIVVMGIIVAIIVMALLFPMLDLYDSMM